MISYWQMFLFLFFFVNLNLQKDSGKIIYEYITFKYNGNFYNFVILHKLINKNQKEHSNKNYFYFEKKND